MIEIFHCPLLPARRQQQRLGDLLHLSSELYNAVLEEGASAWQIRRKRVGCFDPSRQLAELRREGEVIRYGKPSGWEAR
jgi:hypothetical protein